MTWPIRSWPLGVNFRAMWPDPSPSLAMPLKFLQIQFPFSTQTWVLFFLSYDTVKHITSSEGSNICLSHRLQGLMISPPPAPCGTHWPKNRAKPLVEYNITGHKRWRTTHSPIFKPNPLPPSSFILHVFTPLCISLTVYPTITCPLMYSSYLYLSPYPPSHLVSLKIPEYLTKNQDDSVAGLSGQLLVLQQKVTSLEKAVTLLQKLATSQAKKIASLEGRVSDLTSSRGGLQPPEKPLHQHLQARQIGRHNPG